MISGPIAKATIRTSFVLGLRLLVQAGTLLLVARLLGPDQFGGFAGVAALAVLLGSLSTFGTHLVLLGEIARQRGGRDQVLQYAIPCTLSCGSSLLMVFLLVCLGLLDTHAVPFSVLLLIGITETLLQPLLILVVSEHHALGRIARSQLLQLLPMPLRLMAVCLVFLMHSSQPLTAYATGYVTASVLALGYGVLTLPSRWPSLREWRRPGKEEWGGALGYAVINITKSGPGELDKTLALQLLPSGAAGLYAAAARVVGAITMPVTAMTLSALPRLFRDGSGSRGGLLLGWMYAAAFTYSLILAGVMWLAAPIFESVFGSQYSGISDVVRLLCIAIPGVALRLVAGNALMALGKPWMRVGFEAAGLAILSTSSFLLVDSQGADGLPLAVACAEWGMAMVGTLQVMRARRQSEVQA